MQFWNMLFVPLFQSLESTTPKHSNRFQIFSFITDLSCFRKEILFKSFTVETQEQSFFGIDPKLIIMRQIRKFPLLASSSHRDLPLQCDCSSIRWIYFRISDPASLSGLYNFWFHISKLAAVSHIKLNNLSQVILISSAQELKKKQLSNSFRSISFQRHYIES